MILKIFQTNPVSLIESASGGLRPDRCLHFVRSTRTYTSTPKSKSSLELPKLASHFPSAEYLKESGIVCANLLSHFMTALSSIWQATAVGSFVPCSHVRLKPALSDKNMIDKTLLRYGTDGLHVRSGSKARDEIPDSMLVVWYKGCCFLPPSSLISSPSEIFNFYSSESITSWCLNIVLLLSQFRPSYRHLDPSHPSHLFP